MVASTDGTGRQFRNAGLSPPAILEGRGYCHKGDAKEKRERQRSAHLALADESHVSTSPGKAHIEIRRDGIGRQEQRGPNGEGASSRGHGALAGRGFRVQIRRRGAEAEAASIRSRGKEACRGRALRERRNSHPPCCDLTGGPLLAPAPLSASRRTGHLCSGSLPCPGCIACFPRIPPLVLAPLAMHNNGYGHADLILVERPLEYTLPNFAT